MLFRADTTRAGLWFVAALALLTGCDSWRSPPVASGERSLQESPAEANSEGIAFSDPTVRDAGWFEVALIGDGVLMSANGVGRRELLRALARRAHFALYDDDLVRGSFTGVISVDSPVAALRELLPGNNFSVSWQWTEGGHQLNAVTFNDQASAASDTGNELAGADALQVRIEHRQDSQLVPSAAAAEQWHAENQTALSMLLEADATGRLQALDELAAEGAGLAVLADAYSREADSDVKLAFLGKFDESGSLMAKNQILRGLTDPDARVVLRATQLIQEWADADVVEHYLQPLLRHDEESVRDAVLEAVDRLRQ